MAKRLAIFSDIHANLPAMEVVAEHIRNGDYDGVYCLGDIGGYAAQPNEVQDLIQSMGCPTIMGNYDEGVGFENETCGCNYVKPFDIKMSDVSFFWTREHTSNEHKTWLRELPRQIRLKVEDLDVLLCHGSPSSTTEYLFETRSDSYLSKFTVGGRDDAQANVIVFGHTHVPFHRELSGVHFVNTGSVGRPKDGDPRAGYCVLTVDGDQVSVEQIRLKYNVELACSHLIAAGLPQYFADYLRAAGNVTPPDEA
ncbi:MAG: metallophosphoesterase family protein [Capsulimonas sp.]|uniref:metallophosphoesterase family protein n=1 Tax=Capsulimonas sp. TaxID=2494211 RepID=UPI0032631CD4